MGFASLLRRMARMCMSDQESDLTVLLLRPIGEERVT
jgi:hypothetical protein